MALDPITAAQDRAILIACKFGWLCNCFPPDQKEARLTALAEEGVDISVLRKLIDLACCLSAAVAPPGGGGGGGGGGGTPPQPDCFTRAHDVLCQPSTQGMISTLGTALQMVDAANIEALEPFVAPLAAMANIAASACTAGGAQVATVMQQLCQAWTAVAPSMATIVGLGAVAGPLGPIMNMFLSSSLYQIMEECCNKSGGGGPPPELGQGVAPPVRPPTTPASAAVAAALMRNGYPPQAVRQALGDKALMRQVLTGTGVFRGNIGFRRIS